MTSETKSAEMRISVSQLRTAIERVLTHMEKECGGEEMCIDKDYYWHMSDDVRFDVYTAPSEEKLTMGQLSDDLNEVIRLARGESEPIGYAFRWLAPILARIGERYPY